MDDDWILGIYSSGGSAHERAIDEFSKTIPDMQKINVLDSSCTFHRWIGKLGALTWNHAQKQGNIGIQIILARLFNIADKLFLLPTYFTIYNKLLSRKKMPQKIIATVPLFLRGICKAVLKANSRTQNKSIISVDLHMIEPPTDDAHYYFDAIRHLSQKERQVLRLFATHPLKDDIIRYGSEENYWRVKTALEFHQIVFDPPVKQVFKEASKTLPFPNQPIRLSLEGYPDKFDVEAEDRLGLIMLGGIPTQEAILDYIKAAVILTKNQKTKRPKKKNYLFIACGKKEHGLYAKVLKFISCQQIPPHFLVIPFYNQPVEIIFGRADFSITRTGGMTSLEILALKKRKEDDKLVLLHAQIHKNGELKCSEDEEYQDYLIEHGIPLWEGGNARYLRKAIPGTIVVTPKTSSFYMAKKFYH